MKKRVLCFGDSNTWGYIPNEGKRYDETIRWTGRLQSILGDEFVIVEEGMNGRTTAFVDRIEPDCSGVNYIFACLISQFPLDMIVIMLGTNDTKRRYNVSPLEISYGLEELLLKIKYTCEFKNEIPKILVISPVAMHLVHEDGEFNFESQRKCELLACEFKQIANKFNSYFLDGKKIIEEVGADGIHMTIEGHRILAEKVAEMIKKVL